MYLWSHQFSLLCIDGVTELQKSLELVVLGEGYNLHYGPKLTEDLRRGKEKKEKNNKHHKTMSSKLKLSKVHNFFFFLNVFWGLFTLYL